MKMYGYLQLKNKHFFTSWISRRTKGTFIEKLKTYIHVRRIYYNFISADFKKSCYVEWNWN